MPAADAFDPRQMQAMMAAMASMNMGGMGGMGMGMGMPDGGMGGGGDAAGQQFQFPPAFYMQMLQYFQNMQGREGFGMGGMPSFPMPGMPQFPMLQMEPMIRVSVEGMKFQYQLTEDDLHKVFSRYGMVKEIKVDQVGSGATIMFASTQEAQQAMTDLDGKVLNGLDGTLRISWLDQGGGGAMGGGSDAGGFGYPGAGAPPYPGWGFPGGAPPWPQGAGGDAGGRQDSMQGKQRGGEDRDFSAKSVRKYTCRFLIGIENDKEFQVARRIIGAKGTNMKRVVKQTEAKLRLRGAGSGYFEGAGQKESAEPLQLCISCTSPEGYKTAVAQVEELLARTYEEYRVFCRENGRPEPNLRINMSENTLVYSNKGGAGTGNGSMGGGGGMGSVLGGGGFGDDQDFDGMGSPGKEKRSRRSRAKGKSSTPGAQDQDRGEPGPNAPPIDEIERMVDERNEARRAGNFQEADRIRGLLHSKGVALMDEPGGRGKGSEVTIWRYWRD